VSDSESCEPSPALKEWIEEEEEVEVSARGTGGGRRAGEVAAP
jgi:hypothetical protein